jgi:hypothetical protein
VGIYEGWGNAPLTWAFDAAKTNLTLVETMTEGAQGITHRRPDGSLTHR